MQNFITVSLKKPLKHASFRDNAIENGCNKRIRDSE